MLIGRLDRYLLARFMADFAICLSSILALYVVIDVSANLRTFLEAAGGNVAAYMASYYAYRIPLLLGKITPIASLLAAAFTLTLFERRNELIPVKSSGISMTRFVRPILAAAAVVAVLSIAMEQWAVPWAARGIYTNNLDRSGANLWYKIVHDKPKSQFLFYIVYYPAQARMEKVYVSRVDAQMRETHHLFADEASYSEKDGGWRLKKGYVIEYDETGLRRGPPADFEDMMLDTALLPADMEKRAPPDEMPLTQLYSEWVANPSLHALGVRFHFRAAFPMANVLLILVGLPIVLCGAGARFFIGAAATALLAGAYFGLMYLGLKAGMHQMLPPVVAVWGPNILFASAAAAVWDLIPS